MKLKPIIDIKNIDNVIVSDFINCIREYLLSNSFHEITLYDTTDYVISNSIQLKTSTGEFLRNTTEPEIWIKGLSHKKIFCITSLFRQEDKKSTLHKSEFKIVDFYIKDSNESEIMSVFTDCLKYIESKINLPPLSSIDILNCDYHKFQNIKPRNNMLYKVENYPIEESFYDVTDNNNSKKGELFFATNGMMIEFSVYGQVGENKNPKVKIANFEIPDIEQLNLFGMCLGIERTILCYKYLI